MTRPRALVVVAGTGTEVGKTWVGERVLRGLHARELQVAARKPVQSYDPADLGRTDAELLAAATGVDPLSVCPPRHWYDVPMAPPMAAELLRRPPFTISELVDEVAASWSAGIDIGFVELAGGPRSPMAFDGDGVDLATELQPDLCLLIGDAELGTINSIRLSAAALAVAPLLVFANWYDDANDLHRRNVAWLRERDGYDLQTDVDALTSRLASLLP